MEFKPEHYARIKRSLISNLAKIWCMMCIVIIFVTTYCFILDQCNWKLLFSNSWHWKSQL